MRNRREGEKMINSEKYWEERFESGSWDEFNGRKQTAFFMHVALEYLPNWLIEDIDINDYGILDAGCAKGEGTSILKQCFTKSDVTGVDFSESAINDAKNSYPACDFFCHDVKDIKEKYDVVFCSNVLEHFKKPFNELEKLVDISGKYLVLLLPFKEEHLHKEHFVRFDYNSFTYQVKDFYQCYYKVINTSKIEGTFWPGKQILLVYVNKNYIDTTKMKLSRCHNGDFEEKENIYEELIQINKQIKEKEYLITIKENEILSLNEQVINHPKQVYALSKQIIEKENLIAIKEKEILSLNEKFINHQMQVDVLSKQIVEKENFIQINEKEIITLNEKVAELANQISQLKKSNQQMEIEQQKKLTLLAYVDNFRNNEEMLKKQIVDYNNIIASTKENTLQLVNTKAFKLVHLFYRIKHQLIKGKYNDKKEFLKWLTRRSNKRILINDHSFNPMFQIINQIDKTRDISERFKLMENINDRTNPHEVEKVNTLIESKYNKFDILFLSVIDYDFRYQRPQHLTNSFSQQGHRVFYINANYNNDETQIIKQVDKIDVFSMKSKRYSAIYSADYTKNSNDIIVELEKIVIENAIRDCVIVVEYPTWVQAAKYFKDKYGFKIVTDYLDDYTGFEDTNIECLAPCCYELLEASDQVIASSNYLAECAHKYNENIRIIRNGTEYEHFHKAYKESKKIVNERKIVGYYGAIAHWFDFEKILYLAKQMPDVDIVLIGEVTEGAKLLNEYANIKLLGEKDYNTLPGYLEKFDVCLIPFDTSTDLIKATNPVKFYEYLSSGKKIVATEIPELMTFKDKYVYLANDNKKFLDYVKLCLEQKDILADSQECMEFAKQNDWKDRGKTFIDFAKDIFPKVSIILLTYNQLEYTKECFNSIIDKTAYPNYEIIIVDNKSSDDTPIYLKEISSKHKHVKIILNSENYGFAKGNNIGIQACDGEYIILLNNDTVVTRGWLSGLIKHFKKDEKLGILGPVTNSIGNEAKINVSYVDISGMEHFAYEYTTRHMGETYTQIDVLAMFCLIISRSALNKIGHLEELYGIGMFEDDDYSYKAKSLGYEIKCAEDVFIHHYGNVSFKKLEDKTYMDIFNKNKKIFEERWGIMWKQHKYRS